MKNAARPVPPSRGALEVEWPIAMDATLEEALNIGSDVLQQAETVVATLPHKDPRKLLPPTMSDALAIVHARDDAKKKSSSKQAPKARQKTNLGVLAGSQAHFPGAVEGGGDESAFWMYMEDNFRDVTQEDLVDIINLCVPLETDPALKMQPTGFGVPNLGLKLKPASAQKQAPPPPPPAQRSVQPIKAAPVEDTKPAIDLSERRSVRLVSRARVGDLYDPPDDDILDQEEFEIFKPPPASVVDTPQQAQQLGAATGATPDLVAPLTAPPAMTIPTAVDGSAIGTLFDLLPDSTLRALAMQLTELQKIAGAESDADAINPKADITALRASLAALSKDLAEKIGLEQRLKILALGSLKDDETPDENHEDGGATDLIIPSAAYRHPWTQLLLNRQVPSHVLQMAINPLPAADQQPPAGSSRPVSAARTPSVAGLGALNPASATPGQGQLAAGRGASADTTPAVAPASSQDTEGDDAALFDGAGVTSTGGGRRQRGVSNYALMAGKKDPTKAAAATTAAARKMQKAATVAREIEAAVQHPVAKAVNQCVADGPVDGPANADDVGKRHLVISASEIVAAAPQDELAAEILALQSELATVAVANRARMRLAISAMLEDLPKQAERRSERQKDEQDVKDWITAVREAKRAEQRARREAAQREAEARKGASLVTSPRPVLGRQQGVYNEDDIGDDGDGIAAPFLGPDELYDVLAQRDMNDEAFCAVCGDGHSEAPNLILYCDRCDVAVHQRCYDVHVVPADEWLCWPCSEYEAEQREAGVPQKEIRPPHTLSLDRAPLEGGARSVKCVLCPIKYGAFRKTIGPAPQQWVHQACALWHQETYVVEGSGAAVIAGVENIPSKKWSTPCDICGLTEGAVVSCRHPGTCQYNFHVLCARNCGLHLAVRLDRQTHKPQYRAYCAIHSKAQKEKDHKAAEAAVAGQLRAAITAEELAWQQEQLVELAKKEEERAALGTIRINFEHCRVLVDRIKRRERLKKQLVGLKQSLLQERLQDPIAALDLLERIQAMEVQGISGAEIQAALLREPEMVVKMEDEEIPDFHYHHEENQQQQQQQQYYADVGYEAMDVQQQQQQQEMHQAGSMSPRAGGGDAFAFESKATSREPTPGGRRNTRQTNTSKRAAEEAPVALAPQPAKKAKTTVDAAAAAAAALERQKLLSTTEADQLNKKLPTGLRYVPLEKLPQQQHEEAFNQEEQQQGVSAPAAAMSKPDKTSAATGAGRTSPKEEEKPRVRSRQHTPARGDSASKGGGKPGGDDGDGAGTRSHKAAGASSGGGRATRASSRHH